SPLRPSTSTLARHATPMPEPGVQGCSRGWPEATRCSRTIPPRSFASCRHLGLKHVHRDFAQSVDRKHGALAARDRNRGNDAAGDDDHAGFETAPAFGQMIGEPGKRRAWILGPALAHGFAAD